MRFHMIPAARPTPGFALSLLGLHFRMPAGGGGSGVRRIRDPRSRTCGFGICACGNGLRSSVIPDERTQVGLILVSPHTHLDPH
jgi:hypothetical protein